MNAVSSRSVLVLGARGRLGLAATRAFAADGWRVVAHARPGARVTPMPRAVCAALQGLDLVGATGCGIHAWA